MTNRHLPETEIANLAFQSAPRKRAVLEAWIKPRVITKSYSPFRSTYPDAVNRQLPLYPERQVSTPWEKLEELTAARCRGDDDLLSMNLPVARSTHIFANENNLVAEPMDFRAITLVPGQSYQFGPSLFFRYDGGISVAFADLRRTGKLTENGRHVVFSYQHQRFRENFPDYDSLRLEVWRYRDTDDRRIEVIRHNQRDLYSYDELAADASETYKILNSLLDESSEVKRRKQDRGWGPLFGT